MLGGQICSKNLNNEFVSVFLAVNLNWNVPYLELMRRGFVEEDKDHMYCGSSQLFKTND